MKPPLSKEAYIKNAAIYKVLANPKRLEILNILKGGELPVEKILAIIKLPKANVSQHLALLRMNGLVKNRRVGLNIFYSIADSRILKSRNLI